MRQLFQLQPVETLVRAICLRVMLVFLFTRSDFSKARPSHHDIRNAVSNELSGYGGKSPEYDNNFHFIVRPYRGSVGCPRKAGKCRHEIDVMSLFS